MRPAASTIAIIAKITTTPCAKGPFPVDGDVAGLETFVVEVVLEEVPAVVKLAVTQALVSTIALERILQ